MAIIERKQLTGSTAKINQYAGHEGQLVFDTQTKHLHVLSGTAGTSTKLANVSDIPAPQDISGKADKTYVDQELAKKVSESNLNERLNTERQTTNVALGSKANLNHTHTKAQITDFPDIPDTSALIPKTGDRGVISGWEKVEENKSVMGQYVVQTTSADTMKHTLSAEVSVFDGNTDNGWTKVVYMTAGTVTLGSKWVWAGGSAPTLKFPGILVCHWNKGGGIANFVTGAS